MSTELYPYRFRPIYKDYLWGGRRFAHQLARARVPQICAESWEIADRPEGMSVLHNGPLAGATLGELVERLGSRLLGSAVPGERFPLLFKLLDAQQRTSLQVHPDETNAAQVGGEPKTEVWYALPGSAGRVFAGLRPGVDQAVLLAALRSGTLEKILQSIPIQPGEAVLIPGGRLHAIDVGCFLYEVQLNSDTTYRVSDWGRTDAAGQSRPLSLEQALQVIDWQNPGARADRPRCLERTGGNSWFELCRSKHFLLRKLELTEPQSIPLDGRSFHVLYVEAGETVVKAAAMEEQLPSGTSCLIPAGAGEYTLQPPAGQSAHVLITTC